MCTTAVWCCQISFCQLFQLLYFLSGFAYPTTTTPTTTTII
jgi:hypothetical protein